MENPLTRSKKSSTRALGQEVTSALGTVSSEIITVTISVPNNVWGLRTIDGSSYHKIKRGPVAHTKSFLVLRLTLGLIFEDTRALWTVGSLMSFFPTVVTLHTRVVLSWIGRGGGGRGMQWPISHNSMLSRVCISGGSIVRMVLGICIMSRRPGVWFLHCSFEVSHLLFFDKIKLISGKREARNWSKAINSRWVGKAH